MSKAILTLVAILCTTASLNAQSFVKLLTEIPLLTSTKTSNGDYLLVGGCPGPTSVPPNADVFVVRISPASDTQWIRKFGTNFSESARAVTATSDGGLIIGGNWSPGGITHYFLVKLDSIGNIEWAKDYSHSQSQSVLQIVELSDGGYFLLLDYYNTHLLRLDATGDFLWGKRFYSDGSTLEYTKLLNDSSGGFVLFKQATSTLLSGFILTGIDSAGAITWSKHVRTDNGYIQDVIETDDGGWIIAGTNQLFGSLRKLDARGDQEWCRGYSVAYKVLSVRPTNDGGYLGIAIRPMGGGPGLDQPFAFKVDHDGIPEWGKSYPDYAGMTFNNIYPLQDTGILMFGNINDQMSGKSGMAIIKTDNSGELPCSVDPQTPSHFSFTSQLDSFSLTQDTVHYTVSTLSLNHSHGGEIVQICPPLSIQETPPSSNELLVSPNPGRGIFRFESKASIRSINVYDAMGKQVMQQSASASSVHLDLTDQPKGVYYYRVATVSGTEEGKLLIW